MVKRSIAAVVWLLIVAIPVQGLAATAMTHCGARHSGAVAATLVDHALHDHAAAWHDGASHHSAHQHASASDGPVDTSDLKHDGYVKCSACAACCLGLALPSSLSVLLPVLPSVAANCGVFSSALEVIVTGPERPPRLLLV